MKAEFTILMDFDGYWIVEKGDAAEIVAAPERYRHGASKVSTKIGACRLALAKALEKGAREIHLDGVGVTTAIKTEARKAGVAAFLYAPNGLTDLTRDRSRPDFSQTIDRQTFSRRSPAT
jgi:hypothetical protein